MKTQDYIPHSESEQVIWANNFKTNLITQGAAVGLTVAQITALGNSSTNIIAAVNNVETKKTALYEAVAQKDVVKKNEFKSILDAIAKIKTNAGTTTGKYSLDFVKLVKFKTETMEWLIFRFSIYLNLK